MIECINDNAPRNVVRRYRVRVNSSDLEKEGAVAVFPSPAEVVRMLNDRVAYERAKKAFIAEEETEGGPQAAAASEDEFDVEF